MNCSLFVLRPPLEKLQWFEAAFTRDPSEEYQTHPQHEELMKHKSDGVKLLNFTAHKERDIRRLIKYLYFESYSTCKEERELAIVHMEMYRLGHMCELGMLKDYALKHFVLSLHAQAALRILGDLPLPHGPPRAVVDTGSSSSKRLTCQKNTYDP